MSATHDDCWRGLVRRIKWPLIALPGWLLAGGFGTAAAIEHIELDSKHLHVQWGNVAEWLAGAGATAAFGALFYAAVEWRATQAERRDKEAGQARLIVIEPLDPDTSRDVIVRNHSTAPIFDVLLFTHRGRMPDAMPTGNVNDFMASSESTHESEPVLPPGAATRPLTLPWPGYAAVTFTDSDGRRWWRFGINQPHRADPKWTIWTLQ